MVAGNNNNLNTEHKKDGGLLQGCLADQNDIDLEFGRTTLSSDQTDLLQEGSIIPLPGNPTGNVQLVWANHTIAEGTLMIYEGKLAIKINTDPELEQVPELVGAH